MLFDCKQTRIYELMLTTTFTTTAIATFGHTDHKFFSLPTLTLALTPDIQYALVAGLRAAIRSRNTQGLAIALKSHD